MITSRSMALTLTLATVAWSRQAAAQTYHIQQSDNQAFEVLSTEDGVVFKVNFFYQLSNVHSLGVAPPVLVPSLVDINDSRLYLSGNDSAGFFLSRIDFREAFTILGQLQLPPGNGAASMTSCGDHACVMFTNGCNGTSQMSVTSAGELNTGTLITNGGYCVRDMMAQADGHVWVLMQRPADLKISVGRFDSRGKILNAFLIPGFQSLVFRIAPHRLDSGSLFLLESDFSTFAKIHRLSTVNGNEITSMRIGIEHLTAFDIDHYAPHREVLMSGRINGDSQTIVVWRFDDATLSPKPTLSFTR